MRALLGALVLTAALGCQSGAKTPEQGPDAGRGAGGGAQAAKSSFALDPAKLAHVAIEEVRAVELPVLLEATGKVQFNEDRMARILAPVSGQVARLDARVGDAVRARQVVLLIDSREVAAAIAEHLESHRDLDLAEKTYAMTRDLFDHQAASRIALEQAASELTKARGRVARTEESLRVLGLDPSEGEQKLDPRIPVRAPLGGSVIERRVTEGQFVQPDGNALLVIADLASVWVVADVFERDLGRVHPGQRAEVATAAYPDARFIARVERLSDTVDPSSRTVKVRFLVENPSRRLKPEMFAHVTLVLGESARTLTVPARAVFSEGEASFVFVRDSGGRFSRRRVETVPDGPGRARVRSGLEMGERVVVDGALLLRLEQNKQETS